MKTQPTNTRAQMLGTVILFTILFYKTSSAGLNWFIFAAAIGIVALFRAPIKHMKQFKWVFCGLLLSSFAVMLHGSVLSIVATLLFVLFMAAIQSDDRLSVWEGNIIAGLNFILSPFILFVRTVQTVVDKGPNEDRKLFNYIIPTLVIFVFGALYFNASPVFKSFVLKCRAEIGLEILFTAMLGLLITTTFFMTYCPDSISKLIRRDGSKFNEVLERSPYQPWYFSVIILNILLAFVVGSDAYYRLIIKSLPEGLTYASYLHQGVFSLVVSIILATFASLIAIKHSTFHQKISRHRGLHIFMFLNALFVAQTAWRNVVYIQEYGLTEKRLVVMAYLVLCMVAIIITLKNMRKGNSAKVLYTQMGIALLSIMLITSLFNWSRIITSYNLNHMPHQRQMIDYGYLLTLDESNLPLLIPHKFMMLSHDAQWLENKLDWHQRANKVNESHHDIRSFVLSKWLSHRELQKYFKVKTQELLK